jgi:hypothetical protein
MPFAAPIPDLTKPGSHQGTVSSFDARRYVEQPPTTISNSHDR